MVGVNGVGKTTTIAKLAYRARMQGKRVLIAAADTFRAAAVEQLQVWAERVGADFHAKGTGADPAAVAYEAVEKGRGGRLRSALRGYGGPSAHQAQSHGRIAQDP